MRILHFGGTFHVLIEHCVSSLSTKSYYAVQIAQRTLFFSWMTVLQLPALLTPNDIQPNNIRKAVSSEVVEVL